MPLPQYSIDLLCLAATNNKDENYNFSDKEESMLDFRGKHLSFFWNQNSTVVLDTQYGFGYSLFLGYHGLS